MERIIIIMVIIIKKLFKNSMIYSSNSKKPVNALNSLYNKLYALFEVAQFNNSNRCMDVS